MFALANIDFCFLHFFTTFPPSCFFIFCCCFEKLHLSWRVFFCIFFLCTFFPVKPENEQGRRTSLEKFTRSVVSSFLFPSSLSSELHFHLGGMWMLDFLLHPLFLQLAFLPILAFNTVAHLNCSPKEGGRWVGKKQNSIMLILAYHHCKSRLTFV